MVIPISSVLPIPQLIKTETRPSTRQKIQSEIFTASPKRMQLEDLQHKRDGKTSKDGKAVRKKGGPKKPKLDNLESIEKNVKKVVPKKRGRPKKK